jgi:FkbM family methyltransferase
MNTREQYVSTPLEIEAELLEIFGRNDPLVIFDIGSCEGLDSIRYARLFRNATVYAFEPRQDNIAQMLDNLALFNCQSVHVMPEALGNRRGKATFYLSSGQPQNRNDLETWDYGNKSSSLLAPNRALTGRYWNWLRFDRTIEVPTNTIDNFCKERRIASIDFIHIDVQGAELMVFQGAERMLASVRAIWTEVSEETIYEKQPLRWRIERFLRSARFAKKGRGASSYGGQSDELYVRMPADDPTRSHIGFRLKSILEELDVMATRASSRSYSAVYSLARSTAKSVLRRLR